MLERWSRTDRGIAILLVLAAALIRLPAFKLSVINADESVFALAAREVVWGHLPYTTMFDIKPIGSTLIIAAFFKLLGIGIVPLRLAGLVAVSITGIIIFHLGRLLSGSRLQGVCAAILYLSFSTTLDGNATMTEILLAPFSAASVLVLVRVLGAGGDRHHVGAFALAGVLCGLAVLIKITPIVPLGLVAILVAAWMLFERRVAATAAITSLVVFGACAAAPFVLAFAVYAAHGLGHVYYFDNLGFARYYVVRPHPAIVIKSLLSVALALWPLVAGGVICLIDLLAARRRRAPPKPVLILGLVWLAGELVASSAGLRFYDHYFIPEIAPLALLAAAGLDVLIRRVLPFDGRRQGMLLLATSLALSIALSSDDVAILRDLGGPDQTQRIAAALRRLDQGHPPSLLVTTDHEPLLYILTGASLPSRFGNPEHLFGEAPQTAMIRTDPVAEIRKIFASHPRLVVVDEAIADESSPSAWNALQRNMTCCYRRVLEDHRERELDVYEFDAADAARD